MQGLRRTAQLLTPLFLLATILLEAAPAHAAWTEEKGSVSQENVGGAVRLTAGSASVPRGSDGGSVDACAESAVQKVIDDDFAQPVTSDLYLVDEIAKEFTFLFPAAQGRGPGVRLFSPTGAWYRVSCDGAISMLPEGGPPTSVEALIAQAINRIDPPDPTLAVTPRHGKHLVQAPSWLAVEPTTWQTLAASASAGRVVVNAALTPTTMLWDLGNGDTQTCDNPGTVWTRGLPETASTCSYTYTWPSINPPDNTYELGGTISYQISWTTNAPGTYGPFVPVERTSTETIQVVEIQVVNT